MAENSIIPRRNVCVITSRLFSGRTIILVLVLGMFLGTGYGIAEYEWFPYGYIKKVEAVARRVLSGPGRESDEPSAARYISTGVLNVSLKEVAVDLDTKGAGGGLTSFGDELVLVSFRGEILVVNGESVGRTSIEPPGNGFEAFTRAAELEKYEDYEFLPERLRYNDILYYSEGGEHGIVLSYTEYFADKECYGTTIARLKLPSGVTSLLDVAAGPDDWSIRFRTQPCLPLKREWRAIEGHMAGGRIGYRSPYKLILASGDYHWDGIYAPKALAQDTTNDYGKVLEIDLLDSSVKKVSIGHRNMQGLLVDSGENIWATEHGPRGGDELNFIRDGANYGWPLETLGTRYNTLPWPGGGANGRHDRYHGPVFAWVPSIGISSIAQISGFHPDWDGDLLVSSLIARTLFRLRIHEGRVLFVEPISIGQRIRYVHQHSDGRIAIWTDWPNKIIFLTVSEKSPISVVIENMIATDDMDTALRTRVMAAIEACTTCHSFEEGDDMTAPVLGMIFESEIASTNFGSYSKALLGKKGVWSETALHAFITDPQNFAPGTLMPDPEVDDPLVVDKIIEILRRIKVDAEYTSGEGGPV